MKLTVILYLIVISLFWASIFFSIGRIQDTSTFYESNTVIMNYGPRLESKWFICRQTMICMKGNKYVYGFW
uniref:Uncharacterized protein n=1 Tax=Lepeophtheirus salmonis TaxID=72036 RepID=A0A0K2SWU2_LEPSM